MNNLVHNLIHDTINTTRQRARVQEVLRREDAIADNNMRELLQASIANAKKIKREREIHELNKINKRKGNTLTQDNIKSVFKFL